MGVNVNAELRQLRRQFEQYALFKTSCFTKAKKRSKYFKAQIHTHTKHT